jgi:hypothetical protein
VGVREKFVERFGEDQALAVEKAAEMHAEEINPANGILAALSGLIDDKPQFTRGDYRTDRGSDPFKWALMMAVSYECVSKDEYREFHGITTPWSELRDWIAEHGDMISYDGVWDPGAKAIGAFDFMLPRVH